jgi:hypothetical protein
MDRFTARAMPRRRFMALAAGATASSLVLGSSVTSAGAATTLTAAQQKIILRLAGVGAVFPFAFPSFGESGSASGRATAARLQAALARVDPERLPMIRAAADELRARNLSDVPDADLIAGLGRLAATMDGGSLSALTALSAVAVTTVSKHFDPDSDAAAQLWLGGLARLNDVGALGVRAEQGTGR